jgi:hypothetical protein
MRRPSKACAGDLVNKMTVDVEQAGAVVLAVDDVVVENLVVEGARCAHVRKSVDVRKRVGERPAWRRKPSALAKSAGRRTDDAREKPRRQPLAVLQHETLVGGISEEAFHGGAPYQCFAAAAIAARGRARKGVPAPYF